MTFASFPVTPINPPLFGTNKSESQSARAGNGPRGHTWLREARQLIQSHTAISGRASPESQTWALPTKQWPETQSEEDTARGLSASHPGPGPHSPALSTDANRDRGLLPFTEPSPGSDEADNGGDTNKHSQRRQRRLPWAGAAPGPSHVSTSSLPQPRGRPWAPALRKAQILERGCRDTSHPSGVWDRPLQ